MSLLEIVALAVVIVAFVGMVSATRRAAASRKEMQDSVDAGSNWDDVGGGD